MFSKKILGKPPKYLSLPLLALVIALANYALAIHPDCLELAKLANDLGPERVFDVDKIAIGDITQLSGMGVFKVPLRSGGFGVLRLDYEAPYNDAESNPHDTAFEGFATRISSLLGRPLPTPMQVHPPLKLRRLLAEVAQHGNLPEDEMVNALRSGRLKGATLLPFYPGVSGADYLQEKMGMKFRTKLSALAYLVSSSRERRRDFSRRYDQKFEELRKEWDALGGGARTTVLEDLGKIFPGENFSVAALMTELDTKLRGPTPKPLREIVFKAFDRIPHDTQVDLAESWAVFTILGIPDFHAHNWMIHEGHVIPIDLAYRSKPFTEARSEIALGEQQNLLNGGDVSPEYFQRLRSLLSPAFIAKLKALTTAELVNAGQVSGITLSTSQAEATLQRARRLY